MFYIRVRASATAPANPQYTVSDSFRTFLASDFIRVVPCETCPSPIITVSPLRFRARMVVWCHSKLAELEKNLRTVLNINLFIF